MRPDRQVRPAVFEVTTRLTTTINHANEVTSSHHHPVSQCPVAGFVQVSDTVDGFAEVADLDEILGRLVLNRTYYTYWLGKKSKMYWKAILKIIGFVPFGVNVTNFGAESGILSS